MRPASVHEALLDEMSHDMRSSLQAVLGWCKLMREGKPDAERRRQALLAIERNAATMASVLDDTQDLCALAASPSDERTTRLDLRSTLSAAVGGCAAAAEEQRVTIAVDLARDLDVAAGDATRLRQAFERLLREAVRTTPPGGTVIVRAVRRAQDVEIVLGAEESEDRADGEPADSLGPSLGPVGASIVAQVFSRHGGALELAGDGSPIRARLPSAGRATADGGAAPSPPGRAARRPGMARPLEGVRVLVVDDETDARDLAAMVLSQAGAEVYEAGSAAEALRLLARHRPDVVVSDIGMPGQDGHSLIRTIRDLPSPLGTTRAMAVTAFARSEDRHRSLDAGFDMHVVKPVDPTNLVGSVARLVGRDPTVAA